MQRLIPSSAKLINSQNHLLAKCYPKNTLSNVRLINSLVAKVNQNNNPFKTSSVRQLIANR